ncbi:hypothetical protein DFH07DRAFT_1033368 [Mycena maculata]|uniref:Uncharacterized protein n=1 Tax=Mycena maculata TaxID=230809 RepID=A0AAD7NX66_9AGAR|nr:hypothetical protein DFH07DRAFT_1033368 [Mycena maculata]
MSIYHQVIEATALRYLDDEPEMRVLAARFPELKIPHLIHHDKAANFLTTSPPIPIVCENATALGAFKARFWEITANPTATTETVALLNRPDDKGDPDAEVLSSRVKATMQAKEKLEPCLGMVDFWPGSIFIGPGSSRCLVDWEYFGMSTPGAEIGMFGKTKSQQDAGRSLTEQAVAHLHLVILKSRNIPEVEEAVRTFISAFLDSYGTRVPRASLYFKRQALIAYGRELVTAIEFFAAELDGEAKDRVLDVGVRSRAAGESDSELDAKLVDAGTKQLWNDLIIPRYSGNRDGEFKRITLQLARGSLIVILSVTGKPAKLGYQPLTSTPVTSKFGVLGGNRTSKAGAYQVSTKSGSRITSYDTCSTGRRAPITVFLFRHDRRHSRSTNSLSFGDFLGSFFSYDPALQSWVKFNAHSPAALPQ